MSTLTRGPQAEEASGAPRRATSAQRRGRVPRTDRLSLLLLLLPASLGFAAFYLAPALRSVWYSLTDSTLFIEGRFVGLDNYIALLADEKLGNSIVVTMQFVLISVVVGTVLSLMIAVALDRFTQSYVLRAFLLIPWLIPGVTVGLLWQWILDPSLGIMNEFLVAMGIPEQKFLDSPAQAMPTLALVSTWRYAGYTALLFFAGLQLIPRSLYEASSLDGAGEWRMFRSITLPLLKPIIAFVLITSIVGALQVFDLIQITTKGGPVDATQAFYPYIFRTAFLNFDLSYASAVAVAFMVVIGLLTWVSLRFGGGNKSEIEGV